ncbi:TPA: hypothetical protein ACGX4V_002079 [Enterococcus faecalis]
MNRLLLFVSILCSFAIVLALFIMLSRFKQSGDVYNLEESQYIEFSATISNNPVQIEGSEEHIIRFNDVEIIEGNSESIAVFNDGGSLISKLPTDNPNMNGKKIKVTLDKNFATTNSIPPQILDMSIIAVQFI